MEKAGDCGYYLVLTKHTEEANRGQLYNVTVAHAGEIGLGAIFIDPLFKEDFGSNNGTLMETVYMEVLQMPQH